MNISTGISFVFLLFLFLVALTAWSRTELPSSKVYYLIVGAFIIRVSFVIIDHFIGVFAGQAHSDWTQFHNSLIHVGEGWRKGQLFAPFDLYNGGYASETKDVTFALAYGIIYGVFGNEPVLARLSVAFTGTLVVVNVYRIGRELINRETGYYAAVILAVFPIFIQQSGVILREMLVLFLLSEFLYLLICFVKYYRPLLLMGSVPIGVLAVSLRVENIVPIGAAFLIAILWGVQSDHSRIFIFGTVLVTLMTVFTRVRSVGEGIKLAQNMRESLTHGNAQYLPGVIYESTIEYIGFLPLGIVYFILVPLPWHIDNVFALVAAVQNWFIWYPVIMLSIWGIRKSWQTNSSLVYILLAYLITGIVLYGSVAGNVGHAVRWRMQFQFVVVIFAGAGIDAISNWVSIQYKHPLTDSSKGVQ